MVIRTFNGCRRDMGKAKVEGEGVIGLGGEQEVNAVTKDERG